MIWSITPERLFSAGSLIFITVGIIGAYVRWNHTCRPYDENAEYYYPARKLVSFFFASIMLTFPYALCPMDEAVWVYARSFGVLYYPVCFAMMISQYFQLHRHKKKETLGKLYLAALFLVILAMLSSLLAGYDDWVIKHEKTALYTIGAISLTFTSVTTSVLMNLKKEMVKSNTDNYSNDEDFPYKFASMILYAPLLWIGLMWIVFVTGNRWIKLFTDIFTSCWMTYFLCVILHPQRSLRPSDIDEEIKKLEDRKSQAVQEYNCDEALNEAVVETPENDDGTPMDVVKEEVLAVILRRFKEPHLLKSEVLMDLGKGKMNKASKFISKIGYYNLVNMYRLEYARLYKEAHPNAKQEEVALESGFVSRTAYYKAKKNVGETDPDLTKGVKLLGK